MKRNETTQTGATMKTETKQTKAEMFKRWAIEKGCRVEWTEKTESDSPFLPAATVQECVAFFPDNKGGFIQVFSTVKSGKPGFRASDRFSGQLVYAWGSKVKLSNVNKAGRYLEMNTSKSGV